MLRRVTRGTGWENHVVEAREYYDSSERDDRSCIVFEKLEMTVMEYLQAHPSLEARSLQFVYSRGVEHGDVKLYNFMIDAHCAVVKLIDFGCAREMGRPLCIPCPPGVTFCFTSPERLALYTIDRSRGFLCPVWKPESNDAVADGKVDVFCLGLAAAQVLNPSALSVYDDDEDAITRLTATDGAVASEERTACASSAGARRIVWRCLTRDARSMDEVWILVNRLLVTGLLETTTVTRADIVAALKQWACG